MKRNGPLVARREAYAGSIFYGWYIVATLILSGMASTGASVTLPRLAFPQMTHDFDASISTISSCSAITIGVGGLLAPFGGALVDRLGGRRLLLYGVMFLAVSVSLYPFAHAIWQLYILHAMFGIEISACSLLVPTVLLSKWFSAKRGAVIGLFLAGLTLTGVALPYLIATIISAPGLGWRWAFGLFAGVLWLVVLPLLFRVIKERPEDIGIHPDGAHIETESGRARPRGEASASLSGLSVGEALRTPVFWLLALGTIFLLSAVTTVITHLALYLTKDGGLSLKQASFFTSLIALSDLVGKFAFGFFSDRFPKRKIAIVAAVLMSLASLMLLDYSPHGGGISAGLADNRVRLVLFAIIWGLSQGGLASIYMLLMPECFGQRELGRIMGLIMLIGNVGQSVGVYLAGYMRTATGNYSASFAMVVVCTFLGAMCYYFIRPRLYVTDPDRGQAVDSMPFEATG